MTKSFVLRAFCTDRECAELRALCKRDGLSDGIATELLVAVEEARCLDEMLVLFRRGLVTPYLYTGLLRWALSDQAKVELAEKVAGAAMRGEP